MTQGWNRQFQNMQRLVDEYANLLNLKDQGFQLGESGNLRRPGNFTLGEVGPLRTGKTVPTTYQQPAPQAMLPGNKTPLLTTSGKPLPNIQPQVSIPSQGQVAYKLPNGTYTSNKDLFNFANQQVAKAQLLKDTAKLAKGAKVGGATAALSVPAAVLTHKKAIDYYNNILKDPNATPEQKQLAMGMRTKEQIQMATEGLGIPIGSAIGSIYKGKAGSLAGGAVPGLLSQGVGLAFDKGLARSMAKHNFQPYNGSVVANGGGNNPTEGDDSAVQDLLNKFGGKNSKSGGVTGTGNNANPGRINTGNVGGQPMPANIGNILGGASNINGIPQDALGTPQEQLGSGIEPNVLDSYINRLQESRAPYMDALQNYYDNYDKLAKNNFNTQRYFTALSGLSGNRGYAQLANSLNPLDNEAEKIKTLKLISDAQAGDVSAINEIMGNLAMAEEMGLPPEAAFANKNLLTMMAAREREANRYQIALENNLMKKYGIDRNYARALAVQNMRGQNALAVANLYSGGGNAGVAPGLNSQGTPSGDIASLDAILQSAHNSNNK